MSSARTVIPRGSISTTMKDLGPPKTLLGWFFWAGMIPSWWCIGTFRDIKSRAKGSWLDGPRFQNGGPSFELDVIDVIQLAGHIIGSVIQ